jgi:outer membrane receptor protein involved in Fe transport
LFAVFEPQFAPVVNLLPDQDTIHTLVTSPLYLNLGTSAQDIIDGLVPVDAVVDFRLNNIAKSRFHGVDVQLRYSLDAGVNQFDFGLNGSYLIDVEQALTDAQPLVDNVDTVGNPVDLRVRGSIAWTRGNWAATAFLNYTDGYTDNKSDPDQPIDSLTTADLQIAFETEEILATRLLADVSMSLSVQNVFDEEPPFVNQRRGIGYDPVNANPLGRFFALTATKQWN